MRIEINVETGKVTEHEDVPITYVELIVALPPTVADLMAKLAEIQTQINVLNGV